MRKILLLLIAVSISFNLSDAQSKRQIKKEYSEAKELLANHRYESAKKIFSKFLKGDKSNLEYNFYTGICELNTDEYDQAIEHFDYVIDDYKKSGNESDFTKSSIFYKADAYHNLYQFDEEIELLNSLSSFDLDDSEKEKIEKSIKNVNEAKGIFFNFQPIIVTRLDILNSEYDDHTPIPTSDGKKLYFTSKRPGGISDKKISEEGKYFEDIWMWETDKEPVNIGLPINTEKHDATGGLSLDGNTIFIYKASDKKLGDIYTSKLENGNWTEPEKLNKNINKRKTVERHATLSPDGKKLYFSSNRKNGKGGRDIWVSELQEDNEWGKPVSLNINTEYDEESPYMLSDGITFYFSSKGYNGMGGYDIFKCLINSDGTFNEPENLGFPINTVEDDVFFFPLSDEETAFFTRRKSVDADIFKTIFPDNSLIVESDVKGKEFEKELYSMNIDKVDVLSVNTDKKAEEYTLNLEKGKYKTVIIPDKDHKFYYHKEGYVFDTEDLNIDDVTGKELIQKEPILVKIEEGKTEKYKLMSFEANSSDLIGFTETELKLIAENLDKYPELVVNFSTEDYMTESNDLSEERKAKAVDYLKSKGISPERIYVDLSPRSIPDNNLEYTIYDTENIKKEIEDKEEITAIEESEYYTVEIENVFFKFDRSNLVITPDEKLKKVADYLVKNEDAKIAVIGYTDAVGSTAYNDKLAVKRAKLIKDILVKNGAKDEQIQILGYGEDNPLTLNKKDNKYYEPSKQYNRRIEFAVLVQGNPKLKVLLFKDVPGEYSDKNYNKEYKR